jgi:hypothetical protein
VESTGAPPLKHPDLAIPDVPAAAGIPAEEREAVRTTVAALRNVDTLRSTLSDLRIFFRDYKIPDGKPANTFAYQGEYLDSVAAAEIAAQHFGHWCVVARGAVRSGVAADALRAKGYDGQCRAALDAPTAAMVDAAAAEGAKSAAVPDGVWI